MRAIPIYPVKNSFDPAFSEPVAYWVINAHKKSPQIKYAEEKNLINIKGDCTGSKTLPIMKEAAELAQSHLEKNNELKIVIHIDNMNGYGIMGFMELFSVLSDATRQGKKPIVKWYWERRNQENIPDFSNYSRLFRFPFFLIVI